LGKVSAWFCGVGFCALASACAGGQGRPVATGPAGANAAPASIRFPDGPALRVRSRDLDFPIELKLPSRESWQIADGPTWLVLRHGQTSSELAMRTWRAERLVRRSDCEAQARLARMSIPIVHDESLIDRRPFATPAEFDTLLSVGVEPTAQGLSGYAIAIGASVGRCYAAVFTTRVSGKGAEQEVAARLGIAVDRILNSVRLRSVDERAVRHRILVTPSAPSSSATPATPE
jgi:hypothetical protein